jgi:hypothetical protein
MDQLLSDLAGAWDSPSPDFLNDDGGDTKANLNNGNSLLSTENNEVDNEFGNYDFNSIGFSGGSDMPNTFNNLGLGDEDNSNRSLNLSGSKNATPQLVYQSSHTEIYRLGPSIGIKVLVGASETDTPIDALGTVTTSQLGGVVDANVWALSPSPLNSLSPPPVRTLDNSGFIPMGANSLHSVVNNSFGSQQQSPAQDQFLRLLHEQNISKFLPPSTRKRVVEYVKTFNGQPALYFKWSQGVTLKEWMVKVQNRGGMGSSMGGSHPHGGGTMYGGGGHHYQQGGLFQSSGYVDLNVRLRAAMAIVKTLSSFHDGGIVYNSLSPENIVLDTYEGDYVATLIDLSDALAYKDHSCLGSGLGGGGDAGEGSNNNNNTTTTGGDDAEFEKKMKEVDMKCLGIVLNQLFRGDHSANNATDSGVASSSHSFDEETYGADSRRKRGKQTSPGEGLPLYLNSLISALLSIGDDSCESGSLTTSSSLTAGGTYENAKDVYLDLKTLAENPKVCLRKSELDESTIDSRLRVQHDAFYGRQVQMSMLLHLFQSVTMVGNQPLMATISGYPGESGAVMFVVCLIGLS